MNMRRSSFVWWCTVLTTASACWWSACAAECPGLCTCKWKRGKRTAECAERGFTAVPEKLGPEIQVLDMSDNDLQTIPNDTFYASSSAVSLQRIFLRSCRLVQIEKGAFRGLLDLVHVDLSDNLLAQIPSQAFEHVSQLRSIILADNPIHRVEAFAFGFARRLRQLDLANCRIESVLPKAFDGLDLLEQLKLNDNQLQELPEGTLEGLRELRAVELRGNRWVCDCRLRRMKMHVVSQKGLYRLDEKIICGGGPERLRNVSITRLDVEDFACKPTVKTNASHVTVAIGSNATLECGVQSDPVAKIRWFFGNEQIPANDTVGAGRRLFIVDSVVDDMYQQRSKLMLNDVKETDLGKYRCLAENRAGHDEANFTLAALPPASLITKVLQYLQYTETTFLPRGLDTGTAKR